MTEARRRGRPQKAPAERRQRLLLSIPGALMELLDQIKDYPGQERSEVIHRLIIDEAKRREVTEQRVKIIPVAQ